MTKKQRKILREGHFKIDMSYNNESGSCRDRLVKWKEKYYVLNMINGEVTEFIKL